MHFLIRALGDRKHDERGAIGILIGVLLGTGVLFGMVALAFDYGNLNANHSQLQASADAAALKAAQMCATVACPDPAVPDLTLGGIARANDNNTALSPPSSVYLECGNSADLPACSNERDDRITVCPVTTWSGKFVEVGVKRTTDVVFAGNGRDPSIEGHACAAVAWGRVKNYTAKLPFTISQCEWQRAVSPGGAIDPSQSEDGDYAPAPPYPPLPASTYLKTIAINIPNGHSGFDLSTGCDTFNGHDAPGGFGWLDTPNGCDQSLVAGQWIGVSPGTSLPHDCAQAFDGILGKIVHIPIYDCTTSNGAMPADPSTQCSGGTGSNLFYHIAGYAGFYVAAWNVPGATPNSTPGVTCSKCLQGYFVRDVIPGSDIGQPGDDPYFGLNAVKTIG